MHDAAHYHALSPIALDLGFFAVRWYGLSYVAGFVAAYFIMRSLARRGMIPIPPNRVADAMVYIIFGVLVGGRLGYALLGYDPAILWTFSGQFPFWGLLAIHKGGMASHGGMIGVVVAAWFLSRGFKREDGSIEGRTDWRCIVDVLALCVPIGFFFGRIANFVNGELLGRVIAAPGEPGPWYAVRFPQELLGWVSPAQHAKHTPDLTDAQHAKLIEAVTGSMMPKDSWSAALERLVARAGEHRAQLEPLLAARHPSQLYAALLEGVAVGIVVWLVAARPRQPGVVGGWWLISYGVARIIAEIWRLPDAQFEVGNPMGLSRGQWFSAAMVAAGAAAVVLCARRAAPLTLGWMTGRKAEPTDA